MRFVYMWIDKSNDKKYIVSHCGDFDDSYISSGLLMNRAYKKRPQHFEREILACVINDSLQDQLELEQYFLDLYNVDTNPEFYNLKRNAAGGNGVGSNGKLKGIKRPDFPIGEKTSKGRVWITKDGANKRVKDVSAYLEQGWTLGRSTKPTNNTKWYYNAETKERKQCLPGQQPIGFVQAFISPKSWKNRQNNTRAVITPAGEFSRVKDAAKHYEVNVATLIGWLKSAKKQEFNYMETK